VEWRLLAGVSAEDVSRLVAVAQRRTFRRGQVVFHDDDPADALHLVVSGHFAVRVTIPTGEAVLLAVVGAGDAFGELALVSDRRRGAPGGFGSCFSSCSLSRAWCSGISSRADPQRRRCRLSPDCGRVMLPRACTQRT